MTMKVYRSRFGPDKRKRMVLHGATDRPYLAGVYLERFLNLEDADVEPDFADFPATLPVGSEDKRLVGLAVESINTGYGLERMKPQDRRELERRWAWHTGGGQIVILPEGPAQVGPMGDQGTAPQPAQDSDKTAQANLERQIAGLLNDWRERDTQAANREDLRLKALRDFIGKARPQVALWIGSGGKADSPDAHACTKADMPGLVMDDSATGWIIVQGNSAKPKAAPTVKLSRDQQDRDPFLRLHEYAFHRNAGGIVARCARAECEKGPESTRRWKWLAAGSNRGRFCCTNCQKRSNDRKRADER